MEHVQYPKESAEYRAARNALLDDEIALRTQIEAVAIVGVHGRESGHRGA